MAQGHLQDVITWIVGTIAADSELTNTHDVSGTFMHSAPEGQSFPYVIIQKQTGTVQYVMCQQAFNSHYLAIKCVDTGFDGGERARLVMDRVSELIDLQRPIISDGGYVMAIKANNTYEYDEQEQGNNNFYHCVINFVITIGQ